MSFEEIPIDMIYVGEAVARTRKVEKNIDDLAENIKRFGLINPIIVFPKGDKYELVIGQRRLLACMKLGWKKILARVIGPVDAATARALSLMDPIQSMKLTTKDMIDAMRPLYKKYGSVKAVAEQLGVSYAFVRRLLRYEGLSEELRKMVDERIVSLSDAMKATEAATLPNGKVDTKKAVRIAQEMKTLTREQRDKLVEVAEERPTVPLEELLEHAKKPPVEVRLTFHLTSKYAKILKKVAGDLGIEIQDVLITALDEWLTSKGYS